MTSDSTRTQREFHLKSRPQGVPSVENFELVETGLPQLNEGEFLVQNEWLSVDPYMRGRMRGGKSYVEPFELGAPMEGGCVGRVIESKNPKYSVGDYVLGNQVGASTGSPTEKGPNASIPTRAISRIT